MIDWTKPLEAVHEDGRIVPITDIERTGDNNWTTRQIPCRHLTYFTDEGIAYSTGWRIRNVQDTRAAAALTLLRSLEADGAPMPEGVTLAPAPVDYEAFREAEAAYVEAWAEADKRPMIKGLIAAYPHLKRVLK